VKTKGSEPKTPKEEFSSGNEGSETAKIKFEPTFRVEVQNCNKSDR